MECTDPVAGRGLVLLGATPAPSAKDPNNDKGILGIVACPRLHVRNRDAVQGAEFSPGTLNKPSRDKERILLLRRQFSLP